MNTLRWTETRPDPDAFAALFETTGWNESYQATVADLAVVLEHSWKVISAYDGDRLVGVGRAVSDGCLHAILYDIIVHPACRRRGIGSAITERLLAACRDAGIRDIQLFAANGKASFYERHGFHRRPEEAPGMEWAGP